MDYPEATAEQLPLPEARRLPRFAMTEARPSRYGCCPRRPGRSSQPGVPGPRDEGCVRKRARVRLAIEPTLGWIMHAADRRRCIADVMGQGEEQGESAGPPPD